jgi:hypothetical protein
MMVFFFFNPKGESYKGKGEVMDDGNIIEDRLVARATSLREVISKLAAKNLSSMPVRPAVASGAAPETKRKLHELQQMAVLVGLLEQRAKDAPESQKALLQALAERRRVRVKELREELQAHQEASEDIFVMIAGDHGGSSFKLLLSVVGVDTSSFLVGEMMAPDSFENLEAAFGMYRVQVFFFF